MPRRWFQFHLSTGIVMLLALGGVVWANLLTRHYFFHGCPFVAVSDNPLDGEVSETFEEIVGDPGFDTLLSRERSDSVEYSNGLVIFPIRAVANLAAAAFAIAGIGLAWEHLRRHRFQMHLSTCIVLLCLSGAFWLANLRKADESNWQSFEASTYTHRGWPLQSVATYDYGDLAIRAEERVRYGIQFKSWGPDYCCDIVTPICSATFCLFRVAADMLIASAICIMTWIVSELLVRRKYSNLSGKT